MSNINLAIGLGFGVLNKNSPDKNFIKVFYQVFALESENPDSVFDFIHICRDVFSYRAGNVTYSFRDYDIELLKQKFKNHNCTLRFLETPDTDKYKHLTYLTIMDFNSEPTDIFQKCLKADIENCRKNPHYRDPKFNVYVGKT